MKATILDITGKKKSEITFPSQFNEEIRADLIKKVAVAAQANKRQKYGATHKAGMKHSATVSRRRKDYRGSYGHGISRVPRKVILRRGTRFVWIGAIVSGMVGGRRAHPPKTEKNWDQKINNKERLKAIRSAMAATLNKDMLKESGFSTFEPIVVDKLESINKTKDLLITLNALNLDKELERSREKKIRAGRGTSRGRKYQRKKGPLVVVVNSDSILKAAQNIPGLEIVSVDKLNITLLAPGARAGRLTIWSKGALEKLEKEQLFTGKKVAVKKIEKVAK
ncbi:50S ribosomal protein L4 [archaeon]|jgi:large subunit ribosomal protein L4e|nr:50S ribosomal protein L4 [archaeon]